MHRICCNRRRIFGALFFFSLILLPSAISQTVETINEQKLDSLITHRDGKPLLLNIWATWCAPCREEFPDLVRISNDLKGIDVVAISADFPDEINEKILPFLKTMNVPFKVYVADFSNMDKFFGLFDKSWGGEIPATFIYNRDGKRLQFLRGKHSYEAFKNAVEEVNKKQ
ncbi:MAG: TlpA disulfide reductase family protein [Bacteroidota bacterium]|nr:TlpA disulfide reductase family protein [Bacteroidota bacterium]